MYDVDSFNNIISVVRVCVQAGRPELIEQALVDRLHVSEVRDRIAITTAPVAASTTATSYDLARKAADDRMARMYPRTAAKS